MATITCNSTAMRVQLEKSLADLTRGISSKVGWLDRQTYPNSEMTTAQVGVISEFGAPSQNIPPRPIFRPTIAERAAEWRTLMNQLANQIARGKMDPFTAFDILGQQAAGDVRATISALTEPKLSPITIAARMRMGGVKVSTATLEKPLIHTGYLLAGVTNLTMYDDEASSE